MELPGCAAGCAIGDDGFPQWPGADVDMLARGLQEQAQAAIQAPPEEDAESGEEGDPEEEEEEQQHDSDDDRAAGEDQPHVLPDYHCAAMTRDCRRPATTTMTTTTATTTATVGGLPFLLLLLG